MFNNTILIKSTGFSPVLDTQYNFIGNKVGEIPADENKPDTLYTPQEL